MPRRVGAQQTRNVKYFGAKGDGVTDDLAAFTAALAVSGFTVEVPPGTYRVSNTVTIASDRHLHLANGAVIKRFSTDAATTPVIRMTGNYGKLTGQGTILSENASPSGVVHVGPSVQTVLANLNWNEISDIKISGVRANGNIGLLLTSSDATPPTGAGEGSNYNSRFSGLKIQSVGTGIQLEENCNAHTFSDCFFYRINQYCYRTIGNTENTYYGGFTHDSADVTVCKLEDADYNLFYAIQAEPGNSLDWAVDTAYTVGTKRAANNNVYVCTVEGTSAASGTGPSGTGTAIVDGVGALRWDYTQPEDAHLCDIDADCSYSQVWGHGNTGHSVINDSPNSSVLTHGLLSIRQVKLKPGTTTTAPFGFEAGVLKTTAAAGEVEFDGTHFYATPSTVRKRIVMVSTAAAAPTTGTWVVGDLVYNTAPAAAGYLGWVCTVAGTPGTWKGFGLIEA